MPPQTPNYDGTDVQYHTIPTFTFASGQTLPNLTVAFRSFNPSSTAGTILIPTCYGGRINGTLTFTSSPNDALSDYHVVVAAMLGNGESSSPSNNIHFPDPGSLHYEDVIHAHYDMLTKGLGIKSLEAVIGFSMGGQQCYHWAVMYPELVKRIVPICTSARTTGHNYAFLEGPIAALQNSVDYVRWKEAKSRFAKEGKGSEDEAVRKELGNLHPKRGLTGFGRAYSAWLTSAEWFREKNWANKDSDGDGGEACVEDWITGRGNGQLDWDGDDLLVLARMWQMADIGKTAKGEVSTMGGTRASEGDGDLEKALAGIKCPALVMPCRTDQYFRPEEGEFEVKNMKRGKLAVIESVWGHIAGGGANPVDAAFMHDNIRDFLSTMA